VSKRQCQFLSSAQTEFKRLRMNREPRRLPGSRKSIPDYNLPRKTVSGEEGKGNPLEAAFHVIFLWLASIVFISSGFSTSASACLASKHGDFVRMATIGVYSGLPRDKETPSLLKTP
jgi:hypothetical protein